LYLGILCMWTYIIIISNYRCYYHFPKKTVAFWQFLMLFGFCSHTNMLLIAANVLHFCYLLIAAGCLLLLQSLNELPAYYKGCIFTIPVWYPFIINYLPFKFVSCLLAAYDHVWFMCILYALKWIFNIKVIGNWNKW